MTEAELQGQVAIYLDSMGWLWCHIPNEGKRSPRYGATLKRQGLKRGVPDVLIFKPFAHKGFDYSGIAIELKSAKGRLSEEQKDWLARLEQNGWWTAVCRTLGEVHKECKRIG